MRKLALALILLATSTAANAALDVIYNLKDLTTQPIVRKMVITPLGPPTTLGESIIVNEPRTFTNLVAGIITVESVAPRYYRVELYGPSAAINPTTFTNYFPDGLNGIVNAKNYRTAALAPSTSYTSAQSEAYFVRKENGGSIGQKLTNSVQYGTWTAASGAGNGKVWTSDGFGNGTWATITDSGVTSVGLSAPAEFTVANSPITSSGTIAITKANQLANYVWAGPTSGSAAAPGFRLLVETDFPYLTLASNALRSALTITSNQLTLASNTLRTDLTSASNTLRADLTSASNILRTDLVTQSNYFQAWNFDLAGQIDTKQPEFTGSQYSIVTMDDAGNPFMGSGFTFNYDTGLFILGSAYAPVLTVDANSVPITISTPYGESYHGGDIILAPATADLGFNPGRVLVQGPLVVTGTTTANTVSVQELVNRNNDDLQIRAEHGDWPNGAHVVIEAANATGTSGNGGHVILNAGTSSTSGDGGNINLTAGAGADGGTDGKIHLSAPGGIAFLSQAEFSSLVSVLTPVGGSNPTTKDYVDSGLADKAALTHAHTGEEITSGTVAAARIANLDAAKTTSGTFDVARIPDFAASKTTSGIFDVARIPDLAASKTTSGTFDDARIPALAASKIASGTLDVARIPDLAASKTTSGTFDVARLPDLAASKTTSGTFDVARIPDLSAAKITSGTLGTARIAGGTASSSFVPTSDGAGNVTWLAQSVGSALFYATNTTTLTNATTEFSFLQNGTGTLTIPANTFTPGKTVRVFVAGTYYTGVNGSTTWKAKIGATTITSAAVSVGANRVSKSFEYEFFITCYTTGASGTVGITGSAQADGIFIPVNQFLPITVDTTGALAVDATTQFAAAAGNSIRGMVAEITYKN